MSKFLFYSDLHMRPERIDTCDLVLKEIGKLAKKHDAIIINGGDTFNTRGLIKTSCFDRLYQHYAEWYAMGLKQIIDIGNHDQEDREGTIHPMRVFEKWKGWRVVDKPIILETIAFFPFMGHDAIRAAIDDMPKGHDAVVHWGIKGAKRNDMNVDKEGVPSEWLKKFRNVFSGHYHFRNKFENIQYIGSPFQQSQAERDQAKGVLLYDQDKQKTTFIEIEGTPKHYKVDYEFTEDGRGRVDLKLLKQIEEQDYLWVKVVGDAERCSTVTQETIKKLTACGNIKFDREVKQKSFSRLNIEASDILTPKELMKKYVEFVDTDLSRKRLLEVGGELCQNVDGL